MSKENGDSSPYHINKHGLSAICGAKPGNCPLGKNTPHFPDKKSADAYIHAKNSEGYGLLRPVPPNYSKAKTKTDFDYIGNRLKELRNEQGNNTYAERCRRSSSLENYKASPFMTKHMKEDRADKEAALFKKFGKGNVIGHYRVEHLSGKPPKYITQVAELYDNGLVSIYDAEVGHGRKITTFSSHRARVEAMMLKAGEIPSKELLDGVTRTREEAEKFGLS